MHTLLHLMERILSLLRYTTHNQCLLDLLNAIQQPTGAMVDAYKKGLEKGTFPVTNSTLANMINMLAKPSTPVTEEHIENIMKSMVGRVLRKLDSPTAN